MKKHAWLFPLLFLSSSALQATSTEWQANPEGKVRLIAPYTVAPNQGPITLGVQFIPEPGWMVYWKVAGDAGIPPKFDFKGSRGFKDPQILWPRPKKFVLAGNIVEYGYDGEVIYPIQAQAVPGKSLHIVLETTYLTCKESCIPYKYSFTLDIPQGTPPESDPELEGLIKRYVSQVPLESDDAILTSLSQAKSTATIRWMLLLAFLGGVILNVMPCVLPVLSIKLFGLLQHGGQDRAVIARDALASAAGIVFSFLAGGGIAIAAQQAGRAVGWGIQFQSPGFVVFLIILLVLFTLNLWGVFEIPLPRALSRLGSVGQEDEGVVSYFASGMFATLLATPCSAPFLGTAMGFALSQPPATTLSIFAASGVGMALPYIGLAVFPQTLRWLPKPGAWMGRMKIILGLLLAATAMWLGWVFVQQMRPAPAVYVKGGVIDWIPFQEDQIYPHVKSGGTVFVDVTADWCLTCKVNERLVLSDSEVAGEFKRRNIVMMRADWTNQNAMIGDFLKRHGRAGIPFYVLYAPEREPVLLSELLTKNQVLRALKALDSSK